MRYKHLIFDLDGTLIDPEAGILESLQYATGRMGIPFDERTQFLGFIGPPLHDGFMQILGLSDTEADNAVALFREKYGATGLYRSKLYAGVEQMLRNLRDGGIQMYLATSKYENYALRILEHLHIESYINYIAGAAYKGNGSGKKELIRRVLDQIPDQEHSLCLMVGDTRFDIEGAAQNGIEALGVLYGYGTREVLLSSGASDVVARVHQIEEWVMQR